MPSNKVKLIVPIVTFTLFMTEAFLHYNMGVNKDSDDNKFVFPSKKDTFKLAVVVGIFSILNGVVIHQVVKTIK